MKKLTRSRNNSVILGVCGGIGEYLNIDPIIVRIAWGLSLVPFFFSSALIYILCAIIIPEGAISHEDYDVIYENESGDKASKAIGLILICLGLYFLAKEFIPNFINFVRLWPVLLIFAGIYIIFNKRD